MGLGKPWVAHPKRETGQKTLRPRVSRQGLQRVRPTSLGIRAPLHYPVGGLKLGRRLEDKSNTSSAGGDSRGGQGNTHLVHGRPKDLLLSCDWPKREAKGTDPSPEDSLKTISSVEMGLSGEGPSSEEGEVTLDILGASTEVTGGLVGSVTPEPEY